MTKAILKNYRQSPRKVRLIADAIRGEKVQNAITKLNFMPKRAAGPVKKVVESALANAKNNSIAIDNLIIKEITVDEGPTLKRWMPKARGTAHPIRKRTSHIRVVLALKDGKTTAVLEKNVVEEVKETEVSKVPTKKKAAKKTVTKTKK